MSLKKCLFYPKSRTNKREDVKLLFLELQNKSNLYSFKVLTLTLSFALTLTVNLALDLSIKLNVKRNHQA